MMKNPLHRNLTPLEKLLLSLLSAVMFYADPHTELCNKKWKRNPSLACTCKMGKYHIRANILLNKFDLGYHQWDSDKKWPKGDE